MPQFLKINGCIIHYDYRKGRINTPPLVFANSLGTDLRIWDDVIDLVPHDVPVLRLDKRGHGLSGIAEVSIEILSQDVATLMDYLNLKAGIVCGVSVGGMIAQQLCATRPDLVRAAMFCNTSYAVGSAEIWNPRMTTARTQGIAVMSETILQRWFSSVFYEKHPEKWLGYQAMLERTHPEGYAQICTVIRDTHLLSCCAKITQPIICLAGSDDQATPPSVVKQLADALPNAQLITLDGVGHLPCIESPQAVVDALITLGVGRE